MTRVFVVEDEPEILELIKFNLERAGYGVESDQDGARACRRIMENPPDLVILDLMLPGMDGLDICRCIRKDEKIRLLPVIILTARSDEIDRVVGLELGADDYITKPFSPRELVARVQALLRRVRDGHTPSSAPIPQIIERGILKIYRERYEAVLNGEVLELTPKEFQLLSCLALNQGKVLTREYLLESIWGYEFPGDTRTVDVHIRHLRQKIEREVGTTMIDTLRGVGYRFKGGK